MWRRRRRGRLARPASQPDRIADDHRIELIAARQHGAVSRAQLLDAGIPGDAVDYRVKTRRLHPIHRDHRLIQAETLEQMLTPVRLRNGEMVGNGFGWGLFPGEEWYGEREAFYGGVTQVSGMLYLLPDRRFAVAILTNLEGVPGRTQLSANTAKVVLGLGT